MPNFEAKIRMDYTDMSNLVMDCKSSGLVDDGSGNVLRWTNTAPAARSVHTGAHTGSNNVAVLEDLNQFWRVNELRGKLVWNDTDGSVGLVTANTLNTVTASLGGGTDDDWDTDDTYTITTYRVGNPYQDTLANRPVLATVGGIQEAVFTRTASHFLNVPVVQAGIDLFATFAFEFVPGADVNASQYVFGSPNFKIISRNASGWGGYEVNSVEVTVPANGDRFLSEGEYIFYPDTTASMDFYRNGFSVYGGSYSVWDLAAGDPVAYIGSEDGASNYCDMTLRGFQMWNRRITTIERDFAFQTLHTATDYAQDDRAIMVLETWTDDTGSTDNPSRINPTADAPHFFKRARVFSDTSYRVQIECTVNGNVLPDTELGGNLFTFDIVEFPGFLPTFTQDAGWSSIIDVSLEDEGHYTFAVLRPSGGQVFLHLDATVEAP
jgi:hypothetical protein